MHLLKKQVHFCTTRICKPGSVIDSHLSKPEIARRLQPPPRSGRANHLLLHGVAPDRVYIVKPISLWAGCALTAPFHPCCPYESYRQRYISVALVLGSPPAGVTRYPCPVEPGLSSHPAFRPGRAAVQPGCGNIVPQTLGLVKCLAKSFIRGYTMSIDILEIR